MLFEECINGKVKDLLVPQTAAGLDCLVKRAADKDFSDLRPVNYLYQNPESC